MAIAKHCDPEATIIAMFTIAIVRQQRPDRPRPAAPVRHAARLLSVHAAQRQDHRPTVQPVVTRQPPRQRGPAHDTERRGAGVTPGRQCRRQEHRVRPGLPGLAQLGNRMGRTGHHCIGPTPPLCRAPLGTMPARQTAPAQVHAGADRRRQPRVAGHHHRDCQPAAQPGQRPGPRGAVRRPVMAEHHAAQPPGQRRNRRSRIGKPRVVGE